MKFPLERDFPRLREKYLRRTVPNILRIIKSSKSVYEFRRKLDDISIKDLDKIEFRTRGQSKNPSWTFYRKGLITGTITKNIVTAVRKGQNSERLNRSIEKRFSYKLYYPAVVWGVQNERRGLNSFWKRFEKYHSDPFLKTVGLKIDSKLKIVAGSCDAVCSCTCHGLNIVEIKCSWKLRDQSPTDSRWNELNYISQDTLKKTHSYYYQITTYMHLYGCERTYFVIWTPEQTLILEILFDVNVWTEIENAVDIYYFSYFLEQFM